MSPHSLSSSHLTSAQLKSLQLPNSRTSSVPVSHLTPQGSIWIDGVDIAQVPLDTLRSRLAIIPQDPTLFTGTLRSNLDPFHEYDDVDLWRVIDAVSLRGQVDRLVGGLEAPVAECMSFLLSFLTPPQTVRT